MKKTVKLLILIIISIISFSIINTKAMTEKNLTIYFFNGEGCPHCEAEKNYFKSLQKEYSNLKIVDYEVWNNAENSEFLDQIKTTLKIDARGIPITIIGSTKIIGYKDDQSTGAKIKRAVDYYLNHDYTDVISQIKEGTYEEKSISDDNQKSFDIKEQTSDKLSTIKVPLIGKVNLKNVSLDNTAFIVGLVNSVSFNNLFLVLLMVAIVLTIKNRRKQWLFGLFFFIISPLINIMFLTFGLTEYIKNYLAILKIILIFLILILIIINIYKWYYKSKKNSCNILALSTGIIFLTITISLIINVTLSDISVLTEVLSLNNIFNLETTKYMADYTMFLLLIEFVVFITLMFILKIKAVIKYNKHFPIIACFILILIETFHLINIA